MRQWQGRRNGRRNGRVRTAPRDMYFSRMRSGLAVPAGPLMTFSGTLCRRRKAFRSSLPPARILSTKRLFLHLSMFTCVCACARVCVCVCVLCCVVCAVCVCMGVCHRLDEADVDAEAAVHPLRPPEHKSQHTSSYKTQADMLSLSSG